MPKPPLLPTIDWKEVFESGLTYQAWIEGGKHPQNQEKMEAARRELPLGPHVEALLAALSRPVRVVAIAEDWCGDVARHVPVLARMADAAPNLRVRYLHRESRPDVFARFLTNGGEAIPKFIFLNDQFVECGNWGPMPAAGRELITRGKACGDVGEARKRVSACYEADPHCQVAARELLGLIDIASTQSI